jgi:hypothetical protein
LIYLYLQTWVRDFEFESTEEKPGYEYEGCMPLGQWGHYRREWLFEDEILKGKAKRWLKERVMRKPKVGETEGVFKIAHFWKWLNEEFLPSLNKGEDGQDCDPGPSADADAEHEAAEEGEGEGAAAGKQKQKPRCAKKWRPAKVSISTALAWAHRLGLSYLTARKSYYVDKHDDAANLVFRAKYVASEMEYELRQHLWYPMSVAEYNMLHEQQGDALNTEVLERLGLYYCEGDNVELHVDVLPVELRDTIDVRVNGRNMGGYLSMRFPEGKKPLVKVCTSSCCCCHSCQLSHYCCAPGWTR